MGTKERVLWLVTQKEEGNQARFARRIGIPNGSTTLVRKWLAGESKPKSDYVKAICKAYGVTPEWLDGDDMGADEVVNMVAADLHIQDIEARRKDSAPAKSPAASDGAASDLAAALQIIREQQAQLGEANKRLSDSLDKAHGLVAAQQQIIVAAQKEMAEQRAFYEKQ